MTDGYRSYVVRVRVRGASPPVVRIDVEDLQSGARTALTGDAARDYADELRRISEASTEADAAPPAE